MLTFRKQTVFLELKKEKFIEDLVLILLSSSLAVRIGFEKIVSVSQ